MGTREDVFTILRQGHKQIDAFFAQVKKADAETDKQRLFEELNQALEKHMNAEEKYFYPALEDVEELADLTQDSLADHDDLRQLVEAMKKQEVDSEEWRENFDALHDTWDDHMDLEEQEVFLQALEILDEVQVQQITAQFQANL